MIRRGMTLVEMLVAMTATLVLMAAVAQAFGVFGNAITASRSILELDGRMREAAWRLRADLAGATARPLPPLAPEGGEGYFEIIEGPLTDYQDAVTGLPVVSGSSTIGPTDVDDVLMFTTQSTNPPFIGRAPNASSDAAYLVDTYESTLAEVAWFARITPGAANPVTYTLYRKQALVMGYVGTDPFTANNAMTWALAGGSWNSFFNRPADISVRREGNVLFPNTLADLTRRETRFMRNRNGVVDGSGFPYPFLDGVSHQVVVPGNPAQLPAALSGLTFDPVINIDDNGDGTVDEDGERSPRQGEDVILTNVLAFDVRVFDPAAGIVMTSPGNTPLVPGDPGYSGTPVSSGAYVDLGHGVSVNPLMPAGIAPRFANVGQPVAGVGPGAATLPRTYDTWTLAYEANGRDEDHPFGGILGADQVLNGLDDNGDGVIDDPGEFETRPPYPYPLRGIEVRIRCYEPSSRQVRQVTVRHTFVPH
jgi:prepilin-type N-terminal cleavage/methylation domain-containing protein